MALWDIKSNVSTGSNGALWGNANLKTASDWDKEWDAKHSDGKTLSLDNMFVDEPLTWNPNPPTANVNIPGFNINLPTQSSVNVPQLMNRDYSSTDELKKVGSKIAETIANLPIPILDTATGDFKVKDLARPSNASIALGEKSNNAIEYLKNNVQPTQTIGNFKLPSTTPNLDFATYNKQQTQNKLNNSVEALKGKYEPNPLRLGMSEQQATQFEKDNPVLSQVAKIGISGVVDPLNFVGADLISGLGKGSKVEKVGKFADDLTQLGVREILDKEKYLAEKAPTIRKNLETFLQENKLRQTPEGQNTLSFGKQLALPAANDTTKLLPAGEKIFGMPAVNPKTEFEALKQTMVSKYTQAYDDIVQEIQNKVGNYELNIAEQSKYNDLIQQATDNIQWAEYYSNLTPEKLRGKLNAGVIEPEELDYFDRIRQYSDAKTNLQPAKVLQKEIKPIEPNYNLNRGMTEQPKKVLPGEIQKAQQPQQPNFNTEFSGELTPKFNKKIESKIKTAKTNENIGTLGDYLQGKQVRELYKPVLDTPIIATENKMVNGGLAKVNGKDAILINKNTADFENAILEEASHAMRSNKGRTNLGIDGLTESATTNYKTLPYEKSADKMVEYAKTLDNLTIEGQSGQIKNRSLSQSVKESPQFTESVKNKTPDLKYEVKHNTQLETDAANLIKTDPERATRLAKSMDINSDMSAEVSRQLIQKANTEGRFDDAVELIEVASKKATESGRAVQALSMWGKLSPEGMLRFAQRQIDSANAKLAKMKPEEFQKILKEYKKQGIEIKYYSLNPRQSQMAKIIQLTADDVKYINSQMEKVAKLAEGSREQIIEVAKTLDYIGGKIPPTLLQKIETLQTMAQLLNVKTAVRNTVGNMGFQVLENISDTLGTPLDKFVGAFTKERTKYLPDIKTQFKGSKQGFKLGLEDALLGIDTSSIKTQFDLPNKTFKSGFFGGLEKAMNIELRATDRAFYQAAFDQSLKNQLKAKGLKDISEATTEMIENAHLDGLYKTFQDDNVLSQGFSKLKKVLNGNKEWGLGSLILKYPKTPANLLMRSIDYSPLGAVNGLFELQKVFRGIGNQKKAIEALSRATIGTGLMVGAAALYNANILQGKRSADKDTAELLKESGQSQYTLNVDGLKRFILSGFDKNAAAPKDGDFVINYDWMQPAALSIATGANIKEQVNKEGKVSPLDMLGVALYSLESGINTLAEQPLVQNFARLLQGYQGIGESLGNTLKQAPASFVPTAVNQVRQFTDNTSRDTTSDKNYGINEAANNILNKLPGLSKKLPERISTTGQTKEIYQDGTNNIGNVFLNPAFVSKIKTTPGTKAVIDLFNKTGETSQMPRVPQKTLQINNKKVGLETEQYNMLQKVQGQKTIEKLDKIANTSSFKSLSDEKKVKKLKSILDESSEFAKNKVIKEFGLNKKP